MERAAEAPHRIPWLTAFWIGQAIVLYFGSVLVAAGERGPAAWGDKAVEPGVLAWSLGWIVAVTVLQSVFLLPFPALGDRRATGVSMGMRLAGVGFVIAILVACGVAAIVDGIAALGSEMGESGPRLAIALGVLLGAWAIATPMLVRFASRRRLDPATFVGRMASNLLLGTAIEVVASIPIAVLVNRKSRCYCGEASLLAMVLLVALGVVVMGPAVLLPVLAKRRRRSEGQAAP